MSNLLKKGLAMLLAVLMLAALLPATALAEGDAEDPADAYVNGEDTQPDDLLDEEDLWDSLSMSGADDSDQIAVYAVTHNYTEITSDTTDKTLSGKQTREYLLSGNITVTLENLEIDLSDEAGMSPITLADGADVTLVINGNVTLKGGNADSTTGAGAAICVPESATLTILSAHDDRSTADANGKPTDTLTVVGGSAAKGGSGGYGLATQNVSPSQAVVTLNVGAGGSGGGGGAAAAIGGNGGGRVSAAWWGGDALGPITGQSSNLTLSTSVKMDDFSGYMDPTYVNRYGCWTNNTTPTCFGDGGGYGGRMYGGNSATYYLSLGVQPVMLYDLRDCDVSVTGDYTCATNTCSDPTHYYNGQTHIPGGVSVAYTGGSDPDNSLAKYFNMEDRDTHDNYKFASSEYVIVQSRDPSEGSSVTASDYVNCPGQIVIGGAKDGACQEALAARDYSAIFTKWPNGLLTGSFSGYTTGHPAIYALLTGTQTVEIGIQKAALGDVVIAAKGDHLPNVNNDTAPADEYTTATDDDTAETRPFAVSKRITLDVGTISTDKKTVSPTVPYTSDGNSALSVALITGTGGTCTWTVTGPDGTDCTSRVLTGPGGLTPTFTAATPGMYTVTLTLRGMTNFEDKTVTTRLFVRQVFAPVITGTPHPGCVLTAELPGVPDDVAARAEYVWFQDGKTGVGDGKSTYIPTVNDAKSGPITVTVKPDDIDAAYVAGDSSNSMNVAHTAASFNSYGFCEQVLANGTTCGEYEPATLNNGVYHITNAGQLFWFAAMVNGESAHAYTVEEKHPNISGVLEADIDLLQGNPNAKNNHVEWTPIGCTATLSSNVVTANGFSGTFDGGGKTVKNMYIPTVSTVLGFVGYLAPGGKVTNLTVNGLIAPADTNKSGNDETGIGGIVGQASGSAAIRDVISDVTITGDALYHVGGIVGCTEGTIAYCGNLASSLSVSSDNGNVFLVGGITGQLLTHNNMNGAISNSFSYSPLSLTCTTTNSTKGMGLLAGRSFSTEVTACVALASDATTTFIAGSGNSAVKDQVAAMTADEFAHGKACYFLNGKTSDDTVWRQNVDNAAAGNGADPQAYPNLSGTAGTVYRHTETEYSNTEKVVVVNISWGSMAFTYKAFENGAWDPTTHDDNHAWVAASNDADAVTVSTSADTNVNVNAAFSFTPEPGFASKYGLTGTLKNGASVISNPTTVAVGGGSVTAKLEIASGVIPQDAFSGTQTHIGTVTIGLTTD